MLDHFLEGTDGVRRCNLDHEDMTGVIAENIAVEFDQVDGRRYKGHRSDRN